MEFFFEVDHCVAHFTIDVRPESRLRTASLTVKLNLQYKPSLTATISGSNRIFVGFFLSATKWRMACEGYTYRCHLSGVWGLYVRTPLKWRVRAIYTHAT